MGLTMTRAATLGLLILPVFATLAVAENTCGFRADGSRCRPSMAVSCASISRLGAVAMCARTGNDWACKPVEDQTKAASSDEFSRLQTENKELKDRVKALEESL